ncbi:MAG: hypothetical protein AB7I38_04215 [Dehalococcoidia bacterium]
MDIERLRRQLNEGRAHLIASLEGASESDYNAELADGVTIVTAMADLARRERATIEEARRLVGAPPRPSPAVHGEPARRLTPPPVVHDLAGARHETQLFVDTLFGEEYASAALEAATDALRAILDEERDLAGRISARLARGARPSTKQ